MKGKFIVFGGVKSPWPTIEVVQEHVRSSGVETVITREPGGTPFAENIRKLLLEGDHGGDYGIVRSLTRAARIEHERKVVEPALERGEHVLCDSTDYTKFHEWDTVVSEQSLIHSGFDREWLVGKPTMLILFTPSEMDPRLRTIFNNVGYTMNTGFISWETLVYYVDPGDIHSVETMLEALKDHLAFEIA